MDPRITIRRTVYNDQQMTDMNSLTKALLLKPTELTPVMTFLGGREDKKFPLSVITEGSGNIKSIPQLEYSYKYKTRMRKTRPLALTPSVTAGVGIGGAIFTLPFKEKWFIKDYILVGESGTQVRIMGEPVADGQYYRYPVRLVTPDPSVAMPPSDLIEGRLFGQLFAPVGVDFSRGNGSNWETFEEVKHKLTTIRKSYSFSGNAKDAVVEVALPTSKGMSNFWMDYEEWQHQLRWKEECESYYWYGQQSYNEKGITSMLDENNQPVIIGPGVLEQIPNKETYSVLTERLLHNITGDLFFGMTDAQNKEITLFTGTGGMREFDAAMKSRLAADGWRQFNDGKFVTGSGREMALTGFFTKYEHVDGHVINVFKHNMFDHGAVAEASGKHPVSGLPMESYRMVFLDRSSYDGESNLMMVAKKGREFLRWAVAGSVVPRGFGSDSDLLRASDVDGASVHFLKTASVCLRRWDTSLDLRYMAA
jgi:hypothetical protein